MANYPGIRHVVIGSMKHRPTAGCRRTTRKIYGMCLQRINPTCNEMQRRVRATNGRGEGFDPGVAHPDMGYAVLLLFRSSSDRRAQSFYISLKNAERVAGNNARCETFICGIKQYRLLEIPVRKRLGASKIGNRNLTVAVETRMKLHGRFRLAGRGARQKSKGGVMIDFGRA